MEEELVDQFVKALDAKELRVGVSQADPKSLDEAAKLELKLEIWRQKTLLSCVWRAQAVKMLTQWAQQLETKNKHSTKNQNPATENVEVHDGKSNTSQKKSEDPMLSMRETGLGYVYICIHMYI